MVDLTKYDINKIEANKTDIDTINQADVDEILELYCILMNMQKNK